MIACRCESKGIRCDLQALDFVKRRERSAVQRITHVMQEAVMKANPNHVTTCRNMRAWFQEKVAEAATQRSVAATPESLHYLVDLLTRYARSERFFSHDARGPALRPLALMYKEALEECDPTARRLRWQQLGDTALFVAGVFAESLSRRLVDLDYYVAMGANAYGTLSDNESRRTLSGAFEDVFRELEVRFVDFADVLGQVFARDYSRSGKDILRLYEVWIRTGSRRAAEQLRELGIQPVEISDTTFQH